MGKAYQAWNNVGTSIFKFEFDDYTNKCPSLVRECKGPQKFNGVNEIAWLDIREPSVLGVTWYGTSTDEFDMALDNADFNWYDGIYPENIPDNAIDLQTVWSHELGHALGLGHSDVEGSVMEPYYAGPRRDLDEDDIDGITSLYPAEGVNLPPTVTITNPTDGDTFDSGTKISFAGTATDKEDDESTLPSLVWTSDVDESLSLDTDGTAVLSDGSHKITASVTDSGGKTGSASINITVGTPPVNETTVSVDSITYSTEGGRHNDRHLLITVALLDDLDNSVAGASVSIDLFREDGSFVGSGTGTTGTNGTVTFTLKNARSDCYTTTVTKVTAAGWDNLSPENKFCK
jgi:hypothetical protein